MPNQYTCLYIIIFISRSDPMSQPVNHRDVSEMCHFLIDASSFFAKNTESLHLQIRGLFN